MIYTWKCESCKAEVETERKVADMETPPDGCLCGAGNFKTRIVPKPVPFVLKGDGWHRDEYSKTRSIK